MRLLFVILLITSFAYGKELLTERKIFQYLSEDNPFIFLYQVDIYTAEAKKTYYQGDLDIKVAPTYEKKEYPLSTSKFYSLFFKKRFLEGFDVLAGYRKATGTQEYNNIKTSKEGELLVGIKIPVFQSLRKINKEKLNILLAELDVNIYRQKFSEKFRKFYYKVLETYYKTIYYKSVYQLEKSLLYKAIKRKKFVEEKIKVGLLPEVYIYEAEQHIIHRKQRLLKAKQEYLNSLNKLLTYLNLDKKEFLRKYRLPNLEDVYKSIPREKINLEKSLKIAIENRPIFKELEIKRKKLDRERKYYSLLKYPNTEVALYGVEDLKYKEGFKITVNMEYPINRRKYIGKQLELKAKKRAIHKEREKTILEIKNELVQTITKLKILKKQIENSNREVKLVKKLEDIEKEKFKHGVSTLFYINQREMYSQETKLKNIKYKLEYILNYKKYLNVLNKYEFK